MHSLSDSNFWHNYADVSQVLSAITTAFGLVVAMIAAILVAIQIYASGRQSRQTQALETYREYLKLCIERPELSSSDAMKKYLNRDSFVNILNDDLEIDVERALWFLSYVLHTMEEIIEGTSFLVFQDSAWRAVVKSQLIYHLGLIVEVWPSWSIHYGKKLANIVKEL